MSTSNLKTEGQKGLNGPWQRNVLKLLAAITTGPLVVTGTFSPSSTQRTQTRTLNAVIAASSVAAGARSVTIETSEDFTGTILGVTAQPSRIYEWTANQNDDTLGAIAYQITAGSVIIGTSI